MAKTRTDLYDYFLENLSSVKLSGHELEKPDPTIEHEVTKIYTQAHSHRNRLVNFYIWYTVIFSLFVAGIIGLQAYVRIDNHDSNFNVIPPWGLNLLVTGMFGQFVGLLAIVTQKVWDFKPFLSHHHKLSNNSHATTPSKKTERERQR